MNMQTAEWLGDGTKLTECVKLTEFYINMCYFTKEAVLTIVLVLTVRSASNVGIIFDSFFCVDNGMSYVQVLRLVVNGMISKILLWLSLAIKEKLESSSPVQ